MKIFCYLSAIPILVHSSEMNLCSQGVHHLDTSSVWTLEIYKCIRRALEWKCLVTNYRKSTREEQVCSQPLRPASVYAVVNVYCSTHNIVSISNNQMLLSNQHNYMYMYVHLTCVFIQRCSSYNYPWVNTCPIVYSYQDYHPSAIWTKV